MDCQAYGTSRLSAQPTSPRGQLTQHTSEPKARGNDKHRGKSTMKKTGLSSLNGNTHQLAGSEVTDSTPHKAGDGQLYSGCVFACLVCVIICASLLQAQPQLMAKFTTETEIPLNFLDSVTRTQNINIMC